MNVYLPNLRLPSEYQEVEYIQSSGTQYMIIGTSFKTSYKTVMDFQMTVTGGDYIPLGMKNSSGYRYGIDAWNGYFTVISGGGDWTNLRAEDKNRHTITIDKNTATFDGTNYSIQYTNYTFNFGIGVFCYLKDGSTVGNISSCKLYKLDIYDENGIHIYDLVPCYRKSDNVIGLYDLVNNQFYTNAGTGTFSKGNDVTMAELKNAYIGEDDTWHWKPSSNTLIYYPLTSNLVDQMGNGNTGTAHGNVTFNATDGNTSGCRVIGMSNIYVTGMSLGINGRLNFTLNFRAKYDSNSTNSSACIVGYGTNTQNTQCFKTEYYSWQSPTNIRFLLHGTVATSGHTNITSSDVNLSLGNWYNYCITMKNGVCKMFINGNQIQFYSGSGTYDSVTFSSVNNISELQLGWGGTYGSNRSANGYVRDYIVETIGWEDSFVKDYFDYTKHKVGL